MENRPETKHKTEKISNVAKELAWLRRNYPVLQDTIFRSTDDPFFEGGSFDPPDKETEATKPEVIISNWGPEKFESLKKTRETAMRLMSQRLGIEFEDLDGKTIEQFIFFHEMGHAYDFLTNYTATESWTERSDKEMMTLPLPGLAPAEIREAIKTAGTFDDWRSADQYIAVWCEENAITDGNQLIALQEDAYRKLPKEIFADDFATEAIFLFRKDTD